MRPRPSLRICLIGRGDAAADPRVGVLTYTLADAGHEVAVVCGGEGGAGLDPRVHLRRVRPSRSPMGRLLRRLLPGRLRRRSRDRSLARTAASLRPDLVYPASARDVDLAAAVGTGAVVRMPAWPDAGVRDYIRQAPSLIGWRPDAGVEPPAPERHRGTTIALAFRVSATSPARYLHAAMERAGIRVVLLDGEIAWERVPADAAALVVVESPWPTLEVSGTNPGVPVVFWVHHGEHHLAANLRLTRRYGADAVLLAHSWHLAHRFLVPVHPFPFGVAPEVFRLGPGWSERSRDAALVGLGVSRTSGRYTTRRRIVEDLRPVLGERGVFGEGLTPEEMAAVYADSRIVLNEGGSRHLPITMRVFEALGAGALLVSDDLPGTDRLLTPGEHYVPLDPDDVATQVARLLADPRSPRIAATGHRLAMAYHTYDHRVDELLRVAAEVTPAAAPARGPEDPLAALLDADVEADSVAVFGDIRLDLPDRVVMRPDGVSAQPRADTIVVGPGPVPDIDELVGAARLYVYALPGPARAVAEAVRRAHPAAVVSRRGDIMRADLGAPGYRVRPG